MFERTSKLGITETKNVPRMKLFNEFQPTIMRKLMFAFVKQDSLYGNVPIARPL
jgi:hypothetical protein